MIPNTPLGRWRYALKPASWPKLLVPFALGQALGYAAAGAFSARGLILGTFFTVFDLIFIVLLNDWGDREVDAIKRRMFPEGCSPKTIPDGILSARQVLLAGLGAGVLLVGTAFAAERILDRPGAGVLGLGCAAIFAAYTFPPLKLNYRGGGEILEMLGVGAALPWFNAFLQSGRWWHPCYALLFGFGVLSLGSALASGLSDEQSDRAGGKRTFTTILGNPRVRRLTELCLLGGALAWIGAWLAEGDAIPWWVVAPAVTLIAFHARALTRVTKTAVTNAFPAHGRYKRHLHSAIWQSTLLLSLLLVTFHQLGT